MAARESIKSAIAEFLGTFLLVLVSCFTYSMHNLGKLDVLGLGLSNGFTMAVLSWTLQFSGPCSMNPAISLFSMITENVKIGRSMLNIGAQLMASCLATIIAACVVPDEHAQNGHGLVGYPLLNTEEFSDFQCFVFEFFGAALLMLAYYSTAVDKRGPSHVYGFAIGSTVLLSTLLFQNATGACVNIARVLGAHLIFGDWGSVPVYWLGIGFGSLFAGYYYEQFLLKDEEVEEDLEDLHHGSTMKTVENINQASMLKY